MDASWEIALARMHCFFGFFRLFGIRKTALSIPRGNFLVVDVQERDLLLLLTSNFFFVKSSRQNNFCVCVKHDVCTGKSKNDTERCAAICCAPFNRSMATCTHEP